jgi:hypothetical protein
LAEVELVPPTRAHILHMLGTPHETDDDGDTLLLTYLYKLQPPPGETDESNGKSTLEMRFDKNNDRLTHLRGRFAGLRVSVNYQKIVEAYENAQLVTD